VILLQTQINPVNKLLSILFCCLIVGAVAQAQTDTMLPPPPKVDTAPVVKDTVEKKRPPVSDSVVVKRVVRKKVDSMAAGTTQVVPPPVDTVIKTPATPATPATITATAYSLYDFQQALKNHPYYNFFGKPVRMLQQEKRADDKDLLFYFLAGLLVYCGLIRMLFGKYWDNLLTLFFKVTMRQQQLRDQLLQSPLPSLLLNILFFVSGGVFVSFVVTHYQLLPQVNTWLLLLYCTGLLMAIYLGKFIVLKIAGWIFNISHAIDTYIFIVFLVNKMIGIFLLPMVVLMAFSSDPLYRVVQTLAFVMLVIFILYRFIISYKPIRSEIKVNRLHFFVYLCAFEIAPLLLIYKVLLIFVERTY
jgi:hypothetical protein